MSAGEQDCMTTSHNIIKSVMQITNLWQVLFLLLLISIAYNLIDTKVGVST